MRLKALRSDYDRAKECHVWMVRRTSRRVIGVIGSSEPHVCWLDSSGAYFCSCPRFQYILYVCKHLVVLAELFAGRKVEVVDREG